MFDFALFLLYLYEAAVVHVHVFFPVRVMGGRVAMPLVAALGPGGEKRGADPRTEHSTW
jgi:hypothetical protein